MGHTRPMRSIQAVDERTFGHGRSVHLIDIENLLGGALFSEGEARAAMRRYRFVSEVGPCDHFIVASSHFAAPATWFGCPDARRLVRSGPDGADLALIDVIEHEDLTTRFDRVVIASGDGIFAYPAAWLQRQGCQVTVVSRRDALSTRLRLAVPDIRYLRSTPLPSPAVGVQGRSA